MKKAKWALTATVLFCCLCLSSCKVFDLFSTESLLCAPQLAGEYAELQEAFRKAAGDDTVPVIPVTGDYRSSYCMSDFNGDGINEAVLFYSDESTDDVVSVILMSCTDRQWSSLGSVTGNGSGVYEMMVSDLNGDGNLELIVVWTLSDSGTYKTLSVYGVSLSPENGSGLTTLASIIVSDYMLYDFDGASGDELLYVYRDSAVASSAIHLQLLGFDRTTCFPSPITQVDLPSGTSSVESILRVLTNDGVRLYTDCLLNDGSYMTEVIDYQCSEAAFSFPLRTVAYGNVSTKRNCEILCADVDDDGDIEIPVQINFSDGSGSDSDGTGQSVGLIEWINLTPAGITHEKKYYYNFRDGYMLDMDSFYDLAYVVYDYNSRTERFCRIGTGELMFSVIFNTNTRSFETQTSRLVVVTDYGAEMNLKSSFVKSLITEITDIDSSDTETEKST